MTELEKKECVTAAVALKGISVLGLLIFLTIPSIIFLIHDHNLNLFEKVLLLLVLFSGLLLVIRAWHLYFDGELLKNIGNQNFRLLNIDKMTNVLFYKNIQAKTLRTRIESCYKLARGFFIIFIFHLMCFCGIILCLYF